jgi:hypothetical protein
VALGAVAAARVPDGTASFRVINGALLYGGLLLFGVSAVTALQGHGFAHLHGESTHLASAGHAAAIPRASSLPGRWGMPILLGALLLPSTWFTFTVAGPEAWSLQGLRDAPFSPAGETLLAALLLPASLVLAGIWPFGRLTRGPRLAPFAALLLMVVVVPMAGDGLAHWRSGYAAWLVVGAMVAAVRPRWTSLMAGGGLFVISCGGQAALAGAALTVVASLLSFRPATNEPLLRAAYLAAGACAIAGLRATLANEVIYSVLMLLLTVIAILRTPLPALRTA